MKKHLGSFYWDEEVVEGLKANDFDFPESLPSSVKIVDEYPICPCGNYGRRIKFKLNEDVYVFNFLSGYSCQCGDRA